MFLKPEEIAAQLPILKEIKKKRNADQVKKLLKGKGFAVRRLLIKLLAAIVLKEVPAPKNFKQRVLQSGKKDDLLKWSGSAACLKTTLRKKSLVEEASDQLSWIFPLLVSAFIKKSKNEH